MNKPKIRNVAIIAHVDHGKTSLVDVMFRCAHTFRENQRVEERAMDTDPLERERGITILAKNTAVDWKGVKINIIDTPGHADFGGQVERVLSMANGCLLVVDAFEGPMPQTRFVLRKAFENKLKPIVVINKIDRSDARPHEVWSEVFDLFVSLGASDQQLDFPVIYASAKLGTASPKLEMPGPDLSELLEAILEHVPAPEGDPRKPLRFQAATLDYDDYVGRIAVGRVRDGELRVGAKALLVRNDGSRSTETIKSLFLFRGLERVPAEAVPAGDIAAVAGIEGIGIGDSLCDLEKPQPLPPIRLDEPTISMVFAVNNGPFAGKEGRYVTSRQIKDRLERAALADAALHFAPGESTDSYKVSGRGVLHLGILIEKMRREGYEFTVSKPKVILKGIGGRLCEPIELAAVEAPEKAVGRVIEYLGRRRGEMKTMDKKGEFVHLEFHVPSRGLIGARTALLTLSGGEATLHHVFHAYEPDRGPIQGRTVGTLVATEEGRATGYALETYADRGTFFVGPGAAVYEGMVIGEHCKERDCQINIAREKKLTNVRAASAEKLVRLAPPRILSLEEALEYIEDDELVEVTPQTVRLRKKYLKESERKRYAQPV